ncbi:amino acid ABC transporter permease [Pleomorphomonas diazotrophica]|uniref:Amino acid ABC transporter permease n=1 Tax=Pleomorphomonas diazotrophica TaxID=1166257 RepID=A0A1I4UAQ0_9HYPH|nr:amino acid ABC transporter permease [Pleomorphomonas diazotrophica]PKR91290.1 amino acid ABC transporter permease [Pleomorphomonas diazotrophica]SFM86042.1 general L-amino acid transport system permease protein [Pleomorphomonas diazotrophica]
MTLRDKTADETPRSWLRAVLYDATIRGWVFQGLVLLFIILFALWVIHNTAANLRAANIPFGFDFLNMRAGFDISQKPIDYTLDSSHAQAFKVGLLNTIIVSVLGIILATIIGFIVGISRLSSNWLLARAATVYVETLRNIPLLLQLLFWYKAVLSVLPGPRQGLMLPFSINLSNRGLTMPRPIVGEGFGLVMWALLVAVVAAWALARWARRRQAATGQSFPVIRASLGIVIGLPLVVFLILGAPLTFELPELKGFNFVGGMVVHPELTAMLLGISLYTATFIAETVRAGILAVSSGQSEAAFSLGLRPSQTMRLIVVPQAMRVIIPPLTSQYLNLTKNSSLALAIGYPDLVAVFAGSTLNITGHAIEVIAITMAVYLALSLITAALMNWFNARVALVER